jgi:small basic protein
MTEPINLAPTATPTRVTIELAIGGAIAAGLTALSQSGIVPAPYSTYLTIAIAAVTTIIGQVRTSPLNK